MSAAAHMFYQFDQLSQFHFRANNLEWALIVEVLMWICAIYVHPGKICYQLCLVEFC